jgi:hypothetical protein
MMSDAEKRGRVFDGRSYHDVVVSPSHPTARRRSSSSSSSIMPVPPEVVDVDERTKIFVSIPQFRDGKRCGRTLMRLFDTSTHPDRIVVGLIEQTDPDDDDDDDPTCLREYCKLVMGRDAFGGDGEDGVDGGVGEAGAGDSNARMMMRRDAAYRDCPRVVDQIRSVRFSHMFAKGPVYARSFVRKLLGNEGQ